MYRTPPYPIISHVDVLEVPQYLFADADYATPIKFRVRGFGSEVWIHDIKADLYLNASCAKSDINIGDRFVAGSGTTRSNGTTDTYTGYIRASEYSSIDLAEAHRTDDAYFVLKVAASENGGTAPPTGAMCESEPDDAEAQIDFFADDYIFAVEPGIGVNEYRHYEKSLNDPDQQGPEGLQRVGRGNYQHWERGNLTCYCDSSSWAFPHDECIEMEDCPGGRVGMNYAWGMFGDDSYLQDAPAPGATQVRVFTRLFDDSDLIWDPAGPGRVPGGIGTVLLQTELDIS